MAAIKQLFFFVICFFMYAEARANPWGLILGSSGYLGEFVAGSYYKFNERHEMDLSLGTFTLHYTRAQFNVGYLYTPFKEDFGQEGTQWSLIDFGASLSFALDRDNYFLKSPVQYPQTNYYDQTKDRAALQVGTTMYAFKDQFSIRYFVSLLTVGGVAFFNNKEGYNQYLSSGLTLKFSLPF
ncbi:hypothetical protein [Bdellovibrio sp. HCB337]|uniref:hypothetical protein n=1 Tax=Bdellovibrio sp. HCB337 TaxID=3394358 RepID=UPI0039A56D6E